MKGVGRQDSFYTISSKNGLRNPKVDHSEQAGGKDRQLMLGRSRGHGSDVMSQLAVEGILRVVPLECALALGRGRFLHMVL